LSDNHTILDPVLLTVPDVVILLNQLSVLICTLYPLTPIPESIAGFQINVIFPVANNFPFSGETQPGVVGPVAS